MKPTNLFKRILSMLLVLALLAGNALPGHALGIHNHDDSHVHVEGVDANGNPIVKFTKVDNDMVSAGLKPFGQTEIGNEAEYADTDVVRVSITDFLQIKASLLGKGTITPN